MKKSLNNILLGLLIILVIISVIFSIFCLCKDSFENEKEPSLIIAGCARDCGRYLPKVLDNIKKLANNKKVYFIFYENDSRDNTNQLLQNFVNEVNGSNNYKAHLITEKLKIKRRTPRIAHCRNQILKHIMINNLHKKFKYFINMDLDNVNVNLDIVSVNRCLNESNRWDIASINQNNKYYDLWALRTYNKENNCWNKDSCPKHIMKKWFWNVPNLKKLNRIPIENDYVPVTSAFGGFTIYKTNLLKNSWYSGEDKTDPNVDDCEHVNFHKSILNNFPKTRFYIIPYMTND
jgi:hypothetical protein